MYKKGMSRDPYFGSDVIYLYKKIFMTLLYSCKKIIQKKFEFESLIDMG